MPISSLANLPELGVGFIYWPALDGLVGSTGQPVDVIEVEPQSFWYPPEAPGSPYRLDDQFFEHLHDLPQPVLIHGVGFPLAGTVQPDLAQVEAFVRSLEAVRAPWVSEHLSFTKVRRKGVSVDVGFLLPPVQSSEGVAVAVQNIRNLQSRLPVPIAVETGVSYLRPHPEELDDGEYFWAVAEGADCGLLLDLHNVWTNELNGRQSVAEMVEQLPLERVIEIHLAGGQDFDGYWVDAHSGLVPPALMELAHHVVPRLPNLKAIIFEIMPQYVVANDIPIADLEAQVWALRDLWTTRGRAVTSPPGIKSNGHEEARPAERTVKIGSSADLPDTDLSAPGLPSPGAWESALSDVVTSPSADPANGFSADLGARVLHTLISAARAGKIADTLALTTRLLLLSLGEHRTQQLLDDFWESVPTSQMTADEAVTFVNFVVEAPAGRTVPYLKDVTRLELAAHRAVMSKTPQHIQVSADPNLLLDALRRGRLPASVPTGDYRVTVNTPS